MIDISSEDSGENSSKDSSDSEDSISNRVCRRMNFCLNSSSDNSSDEETADNNENNRGDKDETNSPDRKRLKSGGDEMDKEWKEMVEANLMAKLPLWGVNGKNFNIGAQYVEGLSSSKSFKDFAGAGTKHFKEFKEEFELVKSWAWNWGGVSTDAGRKEKMEESGSRMKASLCKAVANFRVALDGATDPGNMIYKEEMEEDKEGNLKIKKIVARNLLVCLGYLIARVVPSARLALYVESAEVLATALSLGSSDGSWLGGVEEKWRVMVEQLKVELPDLVPGGCPSQMSIATEQVTLTLSVSELSFQKKCSRLLGSWTNGAR